MAARFGPRIGEILSNLVGNQVSPSEIPTAVSQNSEEPRDLDRSILIAVTPMYEIDGEHQQLTAESLMAIIELAVICLQESHALPIEQMRAKRLLKGALNLYPEGFVESKTNWLTGNVDWEGLLSIYIEISKNSIDPQQKISPLLRKHFDNWFGALDDFHKEILLDVLPL